MHSAFTGTPRCTRAPICAERVYWAAWADALPVLWLRRPEAVARFFCSLRACCRYTDGTHLTHAGWEGRPAPRCQSQNCVLRAGSLLTGRMAPRTRTGRLQREGALTAQVLQMRHRVMRTHKAHAASEAARRRSLAVHAWVCMGAGQRGDACRWSDECQEFPRAMLQLRVQRAPPPVRTSAAQHCAACALQRAVASSALAVWSIPPCVSSALIASIRGFALPAAKEIGGLVMSSVRARHTDLDGPGLVPRWH
ncbi:hypothetical protein AK812_SmicGene39912 [Symbiodinium microadriaticum]|uniref:Uncharacterized protein n=1 Tax=Symbiodinium microadriaticum TaxID=2951 RepID=A0A1Q9CA06_SYMMI|nr:hypothetical protein AK812_SmicGene39912 [Symbiodinium microadriaticum]